MFQSSDCGACPLLRPIDLILILILILILMLILASPPFLPGTDFAFIPAATIYF